MPDLRILRRGEEGVADAFLVQHRDTSMLLRANLRSGGLQDHGQAGQATYAAALEAQSIRGIAAHCWNGMLIIEAPEHAGTLARLAVQRSGRPVTGLMGLPEQVAEARRALGLEHARAALDSRDILYRLDLVNLEIPPLLRARNLACRPANPAEILVDWRTAFSREALGLDAGASLRATCRREVNLLLAQRDYWVLTDQGGPVASATINARLPEEVTVGGVWTPPELRGRGYARTVVAGMLLAQRERSVARALLLADRENPASRRAYEALGFVAIGDYGLVLFRHPPRQSGTRPRRPPRTRADGGGGAAGHA
jgi:GNAT superfamily N-acetyltransferase